MTFFHQHMIYLLHISFGSCINVGLYADGRGQSSIKQKTVQGIAHTSYKQMLFPMSPAMTSSYTLSLQARSSDCSCHLELAMAQCAGGGLPVSLSSLWRQRKWISPTACAHTSHLLCFMPHHSCRLPQNTVLHMQPKRPNRHSQTSFPSLFRSLSLQWF